MRSKFKIFWYIVILISAVWVCYFNSLNGAFLWDDYSLIVDNSDIRNTQSLVNIFMPGNWPTEFSSFYRPLQLMTYMIDYQIWELNPFGYHVVNVLIHMLAVLLLFCLLLLLDVSINASFFASLIFAVHPLNTEAVTYISGRADPLALVFILICFVVFLYRKRCSNERSALPGLFTLDCTRNNLDACALLIVFSFLFGLLSKEITIILPVVMLFWSILLPLHYREKMRIPFLPVFLLGLSAAYAFFRTQSSGAPAFNIYEFNIMERASVGLQAFARYFRVLLYPLELHMEHFIEPEKNIFSREMMIPLGLTLCFFAGLITSIFKRQRLALAGVWFLVFLLPVLNITPLNATFSEHWVYISFIGVSLALALLLDALPIEWIWKSAVCCLVIIIFAALTVDRNRDWTDPVRFYESVLKHYPSNVKILYNLGNEYYKRGELNKSGNCYKQMIMIAEKSKLKTTGQGAELLKKRLLSKAYNNLGTVFIKLKMPNDAFACYRKSLSLNPEYDAAKKNMIKLMKLQNSKEKNNV